MAIIEKNKKVVVVTINYNHYKDTKICVDSINKSMYNNYSIIIIDNGSSIEDYLMLIRNYQNNDNVNVIRIENNLGYVGGVNKGLDEASKLNPDYFLIMNNDTFIDKNAISELVMTAEKYKGSAIVSGKVYNMDEPDTLQYIGQYTKDEKRLIFPPYIKGEREKDTGKYEEEMELGMADDIYWLLPKKIFEKVGYYSTYFFLYGEQNDYALRAKKEGFKLIYTPKAKLWHIEHLTTGKSIRDSKRVKYWQYYSTLTLYYLHMNKPVFYKTLIMSFLRVNIKFLLGSLRLINPKFNESSFRAFWNFVKWMFVKGENKGYNPYTK